MNPVFFTIDSPFLYPLFLMPYRLIHVVEQVVLQDSFRHTKMRRTISFEVSTVWL
jgi:hypothetical protein